MSPNRRYERGRAFEYKVRDRLYEMGALYVIRAAGSHTLADLVAFFHKPHRPMLVQCKTDGKLSEWDKHELIQLAEQIGADAYLASKHDKRGQPPMFERLHKEVSYDG